MMKPASALLVVGDVRGGRYPGLGSDVGEAQRTHIRAAPLGC
ncbi:hypothetical protein [Streptomyces griseoluteus]